MDDETEALACAAEDDANAAGAGGGVAGTAVLDAVGFGNSFGGVLDAVAEEAGETGCVTGTALWDVAGGAAVAWPAGPGGGVAAIALVDASGAVAVSREAVVDIILIATRICLAGVDCSGSDWILQLSIAIMGNLEQYIYVKT